MSQSHESGSWKSRAAGTLAKRNQMHASMRNVGGVLPREASNAILDLSLFQARSRTSAHSVYDEDVGGAVAGIVSPGSSQHANVSAGSAPEPLHMHMPLSESSGSKVREVDYWQGTPSPTLFKAQPPLRTKPSRLQSSRPHNEQQATLLPSALGLPPRVATDSNGMQRQELPMSLSSLLNASRAAAAAAAPVYHGSSLTMSEDPPSKRAPRDQAFNHHGAMGTPYRCILCLLALSCETCVFTLLAGKKYCRTMVPKSMKGTKRGSRTRQKTAARPPNLCILGSCCREFLPSIRLFLPTLLKLRHPWYL